MAIHRRTKLDDEGNIVERHPEVAHGMQHCPNCNALLTTAPTARHCHACGQVTHLTAPTFREFVSEFINHYVAVEGSLWRTLTLLIFAPGVLTLEYLRGRRGRYVLPLRLFLTASFVFFMVFKVFLPTEITIDAKSLDHSRAEIASELARCRAKPAQCDGIETRMLELASRASNDPNLVPKLGAKILAVAPYAVFALLPVFAALLSWAYRKRQRRYGEHFVLALHLHAFWFLAMLLGHALPEFVGLWLLLPIFVHGVWSMKRVYGGSWGGAWARGFFISCAYFVLMSIVATVVVAWAVGSA